MSRAVKKERSQLLRREAKRTDTEHGKRRTRKVSAVLRGAKKSLEKRAAVTALDPELRDKPPVKQAREKVREWEEKEDGPYPFWDKFMDWGHGPQACGDDSCCGRVSAIARGQGHPGAPGQATGGQGGFRACSGVFAGRQLPPSQHVLGSQPLHSSFHGFILPPAARRPLVADESRGPEVRDPNRSKLGPTDPAIVSGSLMK